MTEETVGSIARMVGGEVHGDAGRLISGVADFRRAGAHQVGFLNDVKLEAEARTTGALGRQRLPCIVGVPLPGERLGTRVFDGTTEAAVFPGDLPEHPASLLDAPGTDAVHFPRFRPPRLSLDGASGEATVLPHIRLDRAMEFLLGDKLA